MALRWPMLSPSFRRASAALAGAEAVATANPLLLRVATGVVLVAVALGAVWQGGMVFAALVAAATLVMFAEWAVMHRLPRGVRLAGLALLGGVIVLMSLVTPAEAVMTLAAGAALLGVFAARIGEWNGQHDGASVRPRAPRAGFNVALGLLYCGLPALALIWVRGLTLGLAATVFLLVCVWAADITAFFVGRSVGGPKLAPAISPNKTWSGAIGGVVGAMIVAGGLAAWYLASIGGSGVGLFAGLAGVLAAVSITGDLYESHLKRRAGVKDSGTLLPGHGGVMDRLDGLVPVAIVGAGFFALTGWAG
jgi:phosphatidate cytidylyltransferase